MKIRIGNDIRLNVTLPTDIDYQLTDIKRIRAFLINTTADTCINGLPKRFPNHPFPDYYTPSAYNTGECDVPCYYTQPYEHTNPYVFDPSYKNPYMYFGAAPCGPGFPMGLDPWFRHGFGYRPRHLFMTPNLNRPNNNVFMAPCTVSTEKGVIQVYFPANKQYQVGIYKLVLVADVYDFGWNNQNTRTYTYDFDDVFELSDDSNAASGNVVIDVNRDGSLKTISVTAVATSIKPSESTLLSGTLYYSNSQSKVMSTSDVSKFKLTVYNADCSIASNQDAFTVASNSTSGYIGKVTNVNATDGQYALITVYSTDETIFDTVKINYSGTSATGISDIVITYSTDGTTYAQVPLTGIINVNTGSYVYLKYTVNGTGSYTKTATWNDTSSTNNPRIIIPTKDGSTAYTVVADGDKNINQTIIVTAKTTTVNQVTGITLQYSTNGITYSDVTSSAIQIATGSTVYLKYTVSGTGSYDTTANWNDLSTSTNPRSITPTIAGTTTYTAVANGNKTIAASVSITASSTVVDKVTGIKIQFSTDGTNYTDVTSTIGANKDTTLYLKYVVEGTGTFDTTANWGDGVSTNPRLIDTSVAKTVSYLVTSNGDATKTAVATVVVSESGDTNITKVNIYYKLNNQSDYTLVTKDITLNMVVGGSGENIRLKYEIVSSSSSSSQVANWFIDGQQGGSQDTVYGMQMTDKDGWVRTFYAQSVGNSSIKSYSVTINNLGDIANNIKTFKVGYYKDNDSVTWVGEDTTVVCANTDVYHVTYSLELNTQLSDTDSPAYKCNWYVNNENSGDTSTVKSVIIS